LRLHGNGLVLITLKRAPGISLLTQALHRVHDHALIRGESVADRGIVVDVLGHHVDDLRKIHQCNEGRIKALCLGSIGERLSSQA
jgi:hypothetical protein